MDGLNNLGPTHNVTIIGQGMSQLEEYLLKNAKVKNHILNADAQAEKR